MCMPTKLIKALSFSGKRPDMDDYFRTLKKQGYRYVSEIVNPCWKSKETEMTAVL